MAARADQRYFRAIPDTAVTRGAWRLAGGPASFSRVEVLVRGAAGEVLPADVLPALFVEAGAALERAAAARPAIAGIALDRPRLMGVLNVTPDSFSDGGRLADAEAAIAEGLAQVEAGADFLDIGGESTRPGAEPVAEAEELDRVLPVVEGLVRAGCRAPISVDTRNAGVARAALAAGARIVNDVSALTHDPAMAEVAAGAEAICLMHARGDPRTMQENPVYENVVLDVYDYLAGRVAAAEAAGIARSRLMVDPGIGFGKTLAHNLALIGRLSLLLSLGPAVLLGVSRKAFIGTLSGERDAAKRAPGSIAAGLAGLAQGAQVLRVHDVAETAQAVRVWRALAAPAEEAR